MKIKIEVQDAKVEIEADNLIIMFTLLDELVDRFVPLANTFYPALRKVKTGRVA